MTIGADQTPSSAAEDGSSARHLSLYGAAWIAGAVPLFAVITALWLAFPTFGSTGTITIGAFALAFPVVVRRLGVPRRESFVRFLLFVGIAFGIVSVLTGWGNGLTDEPFTTPRFVTLLWAHQDPYVVPLVFNYVQYGQTIHSYSIYPYLPLLMFLQIPWLAYKWVTLGCWVGMVVLVRKRFDAAVFLAQPYVVVMAASGYNDFPVLLLLTIAFVGWQGRRQRWAQLLALGAKQFANVIVVGYYALRRDWKNVLVSLAVSAAFIAPFLIWSGPNVLCPTVVADRLASCPAGGAAQYLLNYALWPVWVLAIFYPTFVRDTEASAAHGRLRRLLSGRRWTVKELLRLPSLTVVGVSGALAGITVFLTSTHFLGTSFGALVVSSVLSTGILGSWLLAMDAVTLHRWRFPGGRFLSPIAFHLTLHGVAVALNLVGVVAAVLVGRPAIDGEVVGVFAASVWESTGWFTSLGPA